MASGRSMDAAAPTWPNRRARHGSERPRSGHFRPMDRQAVARLLFAAEAYDRATDLARAHGGALKRTGLVVLRALANRFHNRSNGRCDPSLAAIARAAGVARPTAALGLALARCRLSRLGPGVASRCRGASAAWKLLVCSFRCRTFTGLSVPPAAPGPVQFPVSLLANSKPESRAETRFQVKQEALRGNSQRVMRGSGTLEAALARL